MPINYTSAGYQISPQFANLGALQGLQPLDVTRKANVEYRPLTQMQVYSSQPELLTQGIAQGLQAAVGGISGAITAHYAAKAESEKEQRKFAHEIALEQSKKGEKTLEKQDQREWELRKMHEQDRLIRERKKGVLPGGFFGSEDSGDDTDVLEGDPRTTDYSGDLPEVDPVTGENVTQTPIDLTLPVDEIKIPSDQKATQPILSGVSPDIQKTISENVAKSAKYLSGLDPSQLSVSTGAGPIAQIPEEKPSMSLQGIDTSFISPEKGKEIAQTRLGLREAIKEPKKAAEEGLQPGIYPVTSKAQSDELLRKPLSENVKSASLIRNPQTGQYAYHVEQMTPAEIAEEQRKKEESKSKGVKSSEQTEYLRTRSVQRALSDFQREPSIRVLEDNKSGISRFASKVPELYNEYEDLLSKADAEYQKGNTNAAAEYRRKAVPLVNSMFDEVIRLESGKATTEGQTKLFQDANDAWQKFQKEGEALFIGGKLQPRENIEGLVRTTIMSGNQSSQKANFFVQNLRDLGKESKEQETNLAKYYPMDVSFTKDIPVIARNLVDEIKDKTDQLDELKSQKDKDEYTDYNIDALEKQLDLLQFRKKTLERRSKEAKKLKERGKKIPAIIGFNEWYDRPVGIAPLMRKAMPEPKEQLQTP